MLLDTHQPECFAHLLLVAAEALDALVVLDEGEHEGEERLVGALLCLLQGALDLRHKVRPLHLLGAQRPAGRPFRASLERSLPRTAGEGGLGGGRSGSRGGG